MYLSLMHPANLKKSCLHESMLALLSRKIRPLTRPLTRPYHERVIDHYENPRNVGSFDKNDKNVGTGLVGAPACGDVIKLQIKVEDGRVIDSCFKTFGCGSAIACSSLVTELVKGKTLDECLEVTDMKIAKHLQINAIKLHCTALSEDAVKAALEDYEKKQ